jgi:Family of unknown function (DUF5677)
MIGNPEQQYRFREEHQQFLQKLPNLLDVVNAAFTRHVTLAAVTDRLVFSLGSSCAEDFGEILLLCGNGYGIGAKKILRGMYERAVTAWHLHNHPEDAENFIDFGWVREYQFMKKLKEAFGENLFDDHPDRRKNFEEARAKYEKAKQKFMVACKKCGTKRPNHTWTKLDFVTMARKVEILGEPALIMAAYDDPTQQAHATMSALLAKMKQRPTGGVAFGRDLEREGQAVKGVLVTAHGILLAVLELQLVHFGLKTLEQPLRCCSQDFNEIWVNSDATM